MNDWSACLEEEEIDALMRVVARQLKLWREAAGMTQAEFGAAIGYGEELISSVERGRRIPRPEFLDRADEALGADGKVAAMKRDVAEARYPKRMRDLKRLEEEAVEVCAYNNSVIHGLLQTEDYARGVFSARRPPFTDDELEQQVAARLSRREILERRPGSPMFGFVQCESTLLRPYGGRMAMRKQLERLLELGRLRHIDIQIMPLRREDNVGVDGSFHLVRHKDGSTSGQVEVQQVNRVITDPKQVQVLNVRYGVIRAQALTPRESLAFIEKVLGEA